MSEWQPIETAPKDGRPILVWLEAPSLGSHIHSARIGGKGRPSIIGHQFAFDCPKATHWMEQPSGPDGKP